jgi:hypothetical protein
MRLYFLSLLAVSLLSTVSASEASAEVPDGARREGVEWKLRLTEDFVGTELDGKLWRRIGKGGSDWNRHMSKREDLVAVSGGQLHLHGVKNGDLTQDRRPMLTGGVFMKGRFTMKYGKVEVRCRLEAQKGAWPAIWMMPENCSTVKWPECGEIDIMERLNSDNFVYQTVHSAWTKKNPDNPPYCGKGRIDPDGWNVFGLEWTPKSIVWTVNGGVTHSYRKVGDDPLRYPWTTPFFLMIDMQLGGEWVGRVDMDTLPVSMHIDWVKFYEGFEDGVKFSEFAMPAKK